MSKHAHALAHMHAHKHHSKQRPAHVVHFIGLHISDAKIVSARTGIPVAVILAQSALESNWGRSVKGSHEAIVLLASPVLAYGRARSRRPNKDPG